MVVVAYDFRWDILLLLFSVRDPSTFQQFRYMQTVKKYTKKKLFFYLKRKFYRYILILGSNKKENHSRTHYIAMPFLFILFFLLLKWYIKKHLLLSFRFYLRFIISARKKKMFSQYSFMVWIHLVYFMFSFACSCMFKKKKDFSSLTKSVVNWLDICVVCNKTNSSIIVVKQFQLPKWKFVKFTVKVFKREWKVASTLCCNVIKFIGGNNGSLFSF